MATAEKLQDFYLKPIFKHLFTGNRYFIAGLILKIILSFLFASTFLSDLFAPFIKSAIGSDFFGVYKDFFPVKPNAFPYPPVMLYILSLPRYLAGLLFGNNEAVSFIDLFSLRIPLLCFDIAITIILIKWLRNVREVIRWYWFNPIVLYVSYIHGQLDIIPTALLCISLHFLFTNRLKSFLVFLALACATKFHIIITVPLLLIFLYRTRKLTPVLLLKGLSIFVTLLFLLNMPFLFQQEFISMVYQNHEQSKVLDAYYDIFEHYRFSFIPACYIMIVYFMIGFKFINKDILIIFLALSFGTITFFVVPGQGWYLWNIPFFVYFVVRFKMRAKNLFIGLNIAYFLFFITFPKSDFPLVAQFLLPGMRNAKNVYALLLSWNIDPTVLLQIIFTLLQTLLLLFCIAIFHLGLRELKKYKIYYQPYMIGICGDSGTGKSVLSNTICRLFGDANSLVIRGDDMHRWERGHEKWNEITHLNPQANWLHKDLADLMNLKAGNKIKRRSYDHDTGKFNELEEISASKVIIYEGLHAFYLKRASNIYDLKIFMRPAEELRVQWKTERDMEERGKTYEEVVHSIQKRMPDSMAHIASQESEADMVFSILTTNDQVPGESGYSLKVTSSNDVFFEDLLDALSAEQLMIEHFIDQHKQEMTIFGTISARKIAGIAYQLKINMEDIIGFPSVWDSNYYGVMQLFVAYTIFNQLETSGVIVAQ